MCCQSQKHEIFFTNLRISSYCDPRWVISIFNRFFYSILFGFQSRITGIVDTKWVGLKIANNLAILGVIRNPRKAIINGPLYPCCDFDFFIHRKKTWVLKNLSSKSSDAVPFYAIEFLHIIITPWAIGLDHLVGSRPDWSIKSGQ